MRIKPFTAKAVLFDFDGTLTAPGALDFNEIKKAVDCPPDIPVLEFIKNLKDPGQQSKAFTILNRFEETGAKNSRPNDGAEDVIQVLKTLGLKLAIISRNSRRSIDLALENFRNVDTSCIDLIISRDDPVTPKPSTEGILFAANAFQIDPRNILMVGDFIFDIQAGRDAGAVTVFINNGSGHSEPDSDFTISRLCELKQVIRWGLPLQTGKLPQALLETFISDFEISDASVLIRPGVGEDTTALDLNRAEVLILTSDPITFATDAIGRYAVVVNANDMATSGALPQWLLTTLLFPCGVTPSEIGRTMYDLVQTCRQWDLTLCGGHTEITDAVSRPVVVGTMAGTVAKSDLINKSNIKPGDRLLVTKGVSVEGTAIVAREFGEKLKDLGMSMEEVDRCRNFLSEISVLTEAKIACGTPGISALHDITEGGLATAVEELSIAGRCGIRLEMDSIPVFPETGKICRLLGLDPLGLIGSGSLLICCRESAVDDLLKNLHQAGVNGACIGEIIGKGKGVEALQHGRPVDWPRFEVDEITKLF